MNIEYNLDDKLNYILSLEEGEYLSDDDWSNIKRLSRDKDSEVRFRVTELLALFQSDESVRLLVSLLNDDDHLVRASACDSLSFGNSIDILKLLLKAAKDKRYIVRGYAILSIGDVQNNIGSNANEIIRILKSLYLKESSEWVKIAIARSLYTLGEVSYLYPMLNRLNTRYYKNRCFVLNLLEQLIDSNKISNISELQQILNKRLEIEKVISVKTTLKKLISKI